MKLGFFTDSYLPNVDGVVRSIVSTRPELEKRGHEVYTFASGTVQDGRANRDSRVFYYRSLKFPAYPQYKIALFPYYSARKKARELELDLVHCHGMAAMGIAGRKAARDLHLPAVGSFHTLLPKGIQTIARRKWTRALGEAFLWRAMEWFYKPLDLVISPSEVIRKILLQHEIDSVVVPNGIDLAKIHQLPKSVARKAVAKEIGLQKGEKIILSAGRLSKEKHLEVVLHAFPKVLAHADSRLVVTGEGPARKEWEAAARKSGVSDKIVFTGFVPEEELPEFYSAADCFATASTFETQGMALLEAMACGTPVVGARSLAIPEVLKEGKNGFLFTPFHSHELAEKIVKLLEAGSARQKVFSKNALATAEKFSLEKTTDLLLQAYEKVL